MGRNASAPVRPSTFAQIETAIRARQVAVAAVQRNREAPLPRRIPGETAIVDMLNRAAARDVAPGTALPVDTLLKVVEVARIIKKGRSSTGKLISTGQIPSVKIGRSRLVRTSDLNAYLASLPLTVPTPRKEPAR